mgnify:CR=1 FL=1
MNISMIAQLAEVSTATVSRYLNNGYVSEQKRKRIQAVIEQTGYTPSSSAQTLRTGRNNLIGVIVPKISSESVSRMVDGITEVVNNAGYQVLLANTGNNTEPGNGIPENVPVEQRRRRDLYRNADDEKAPRSDEIL